MGRRWNAFKYAAAEFLPDGMPFGPMRREPMPVDKARLGEPEAVIDPSRVLIGWTFTPYNPSALVTRKGLTVFDKMKLDEQVKACLSFKKSSIMASGWEIVSPADEDETWEVTELVRNTITQFPSGWSKALLKIMLGIDYGYSVTEKIFGNPTWDPSKLVPIKLNSLKPHYIDFMTSPSGELLNLIQTSAAGSGRGVELPPDKFVIYTHDEEFENKYGRSELEACYRPWFVKDNAYKWYAVYLERYGMAPLIAMYNPNSYVGAELNGLKKLIRAIQNATLALVPRGAKDDLEMWSQQVSAQSKEIFLSALGRFDADIGKGLLVPSLIGATSDSGGKGGEQAQGSYARSQTHFDLFMMTVTTMQDMIATIVNEQFIKQTCDLNFPDLEKYPLFRFLPVSDELMIELYKTWQALVAGKVVNRIEDDEAHIRKAFGFPENENPTIEALPVDMPKPGFDPEGRPYPKPTGDEPKPKPVPKEKQTKEMQEYAEDRHAIWVYIGGDMVCLSLADYVVAA